jgi:yeast amino acid transporter
MAAPPYTSQDLSKIITEGSLDSSIYELPLPAPARKERGMWTRLVHSFRRKTNEAHGEFALGNADADRKAGDLTRLSRKLKTRHLQMIAIGGSIGCGLFIGSGAALKTGGPGAVVMDFCIIGLMIFCMVNAMGELATLFPVQGISGDGGGR